MQKSSATYPCFQSVVQTDCVTDHRRGAGARVFRVVESLYAMSASCHITASVVPSLPSPTRTRLLHASCIFYEQVFPEIAHALKTQMATRQLLMFHARIVDHLAEHGNITDKELEQFSHKADEMQSKLRSHPLTEKLPRRSEMLSKVEIYYLVVTAIFGDSS